MSSQSESDTTKKKTLCELHKEGYVANNLEGYKELVKNSTHVCKVCGRTAAEPNRLHKPDEL